MKMSRKGVKSVHYTPAEDALIREYYPQFGAKMLVTLFHQRGFTRTDNGLTARARKLGISYEGKKLGCFKKGQQPANKGKKMDPSKITDAMRSTMFKKGQRPKNHVPVLSLNRRVRKNRFRSDGQPVVYTWIKVAEPNKWIMYHRYLFEEYFGEVPKGWIVIFRDGDTDNLDPYNLEMITMAENATRNSRNRKKRRTDDQLTDGAVAQHIAKKNPKLFKEVIKDRELLEVARLNYKLNQEITENEQ